MDNQKKKGHDEKVFQRIVETSDKIVNHFREPGLKKENNLSDSNFLDNVK